ncbi:TetR/AcrR family transcriptional regulator [Acidomonas methanolica]|uniref:TetR/AcrR family transcriptional regulator n=1 Tax=Acidomonas methanolica TaxID=437 RepID=UPI002119FE87|nr:TetR/AcrR family transcriptional regulator [Acidomonas methanolica]MCQ9156950.1 TetR/AcrR family transcriptional regulator [Acidomonas methanolica]
MNPIPREPRQARSRVSEAKLIEATITTLQAHGFEETTVPRIARTAGLTSGALYRRFTDKDELLRRCVLHVLEDQLHHTRALLPEDRVERCPLTELVTDIVADMLTSYRSRPRLIEALMQVMKSSSDEAFREKAAALEVATMDHLVKTLLKKRDEIRHPEPKTAIRMAFLVLSASLGAIFVRHPDRTALKSVAPFNDATLQREMERLVLGYLGVRNLAEANVEKGRRTRAS